jgi:beta-lactamase class D
MIDRRAFSKGLLLLAGTAGTGFPAVTARATASKLAISCVVVIDARTGTILHRDGPCERRFSPFSTFKVPIALMGFDAGILKTPYDPRWDYKDSFGAWRDRDKKAYDPAGWLRDSVVWYSQETTRKLGMDRFQSYVRQFGYGNEDVSGNPGKGDGLTRSWLLSSLAISPDEQALFVKRMLDQDLGLSERSYRMTRESMPAFSGEGGWRIHGKTGGGWLPGKDGKANRNRPQGWFVGWAERGEQVVAFARLRVATAPSDRSPGMIAREEALASLAQWAEN